MPIVEKTKSKSKMEAVFFCSPLVEMAASLHVLSDPSHHENCIHWAVNLRKELSKELLKEIDYFSDMYSQWDFIMDVMTEAAGQRDDDMEAGLERIEKMDDLEFSYYFLGLSAIDCEKKFLNDLQEWMKSPERLTLQDLGEQGRYLDLSSVKAYLSDIPKVRSRLMKILRQYWDEAFEHEWNKIKKYIRKVILNQEVILKEQSTESYIMSLHSDIKIVDGSIVLRKDIDFKQDMSLVRRFHIFPSVFTAPHLMLNISGNIVTIYYNLNYHSVEMSESVPKEVMEGLKAISDGTRLKIMKYLRNSEATTQELSQVIGLDASTISLQLKVLKRANLLSKRKVKKFVYYSFIEENLKDIWRKTTDFLEH